MRNTLFSKVSSLSSMANCTWTKFLPQVSKGILTKALPLVGLSSPTSKRRPLTAPSIATENGGPAYYGTFGRERL